MNYIRLKRMLRCVAQGADVSVWDRHFAVAFVRGTVSEAFSQCQIPNSLMRQNSFVNDEAVAI